MLLSHWHDPACNKCIWNHYYTVPYTILWLSLSPFVSVSNLLTQADGRWTVDRTHHMTIYLYSCTRTTVQCASLIFLCILVHTSSCNRPKQWKTWSTSSTITLMPMCSIDSATSMPYSSWTQMSFNISFHTLACTNSCDRFKQQKIWSTSSTVAQKTVPMFGCLAKIDAA